MKGKFWVIEGLDGCGKTTQMECLKQALEKRNIPYKYIHFPMLNKGVFGEIGAYYNGNPTVNLTPSGSATANTEGVTADFAQQVGLEEDNIRNDNEYEWLPVAKLGVSFRF